MDRGFVQEIARLRRLTVAELRARYADVFGEESESCNKDYLWKRIAFRLHLLAQVEARSASGRRRRPSRR